MSLPFYLLFMPGSCAINFRARENTQYFGQVNYAVTAQFLSPPVHNLYAIIAFCCERLYFRFGSLFINPGKADTEIRKKDLFWLKYNICMYILNNLLICDYLKSYSEYKKITCYLFSLFTTRIEKKIFW